ncbi:hypothetical protein Salat_1745200 [Sesamum alatum]|uniref:Uncharacterized protein n=1 Tax=Sesamum alatum TaxID=300844 RepID=A0AAE1Y8M6_9LAMI|nr:hypothetical protein Salat_1745200 [Sesamum alatum]
MFVSGDSRVNMVLGFDDSLQNVLTKTMLSQEEIFRNQVLELHRLYQIQKIMMKELDAKMGGGDSPHLFVGPFSKHMKYESLATETKFREVHMMCSPRSLKNPCLQEHRAIPKHQCRPLDLELSPSHYTHYDEDLTRESFGRITREVSGKMKYGVYDDKLSSMEELKLSLGADAEAWQKVGSRKTCKDKIICSPSRETISLEGSAYFGDLVARPGLGCPIQVTKSGAKHEFGGSSCSFKSGKTDVFDRISESPSVTDGRPNLLERKHLNQGFEKCHEELPQKSMSTRRKLFTSHEVGELDLNKALPDESSVYSIDHWTSNPSKCTSSGITDNEVGEYGTSTFSTALDSRKPKNNCSSEPSALGRQDMENSTLTTLPSRYTGEHICESILCSPDIGSDCRPPFDNKDANFRPERAESEISFPDKTCQKTSMPEMSSKKNNEEKLHSQYSCQELVEGTDSNRSPISCKSDGTTDDTSSNTRTRQCGIGTSNSNVSATVFQNSESSLVTKTPVEQDGTTSMEMKSQSSYSKQEEEVDITVRKGAVSLLYFSLECSARIKDRSPQPQRAKESCNVEKDVPQSSSESYEAIVLNQQECSADEYCMSSTPFEVSSSDKKDHGVKLRRGRRMKDFQKEILPSLSSLSRQEICEDIKIMELAIRSREYKKYRSKTANRNDCFSSARSKRSRLSYVGRRYYS